MYVCGLCKISMRLSDRVRCQFRSSPSLRTSRSGALQNRTNDPGPGLCGCELVMVARRYSDANAGGLPFLATGSRTAHAAGHQQAFRFTPAVGGRIANDSEVWRLVRPAPTSPICPRHRASPLAGNHCGRIHSDKGKEISIAATGGIGRLDIAVALSGSPTKSGMEARAHMA